MTPIQRYGLQAHEGPYASWPLTSALRVDGAMTDTQVPGYQVEAQYQTALGALLVTSYDCLFEESNAFVLLDASHAVVAQAQLGAPYASFLLNAHWPIDALALALHYGENLFYTLTVQPGGGWLRRSPRLRLRRALAWRQDARMRQSHERLQADLARIAAELHADTGRA